MMSASPIAASCICCSDRTTPSKRALHERQSARWPLSPASTQISISSSSLKCAVTGVFPKLTMRLLNRMPLSFHGRAQFADGSEQMNPYSRFVQTCHLGHVARRMIGVMTEHEHQPLAVGQLLHRGHEL